MGRLDRLDGSDKAEFAFVLADDWHGRGLGSALFTRLVHRARQVGVGRFVAETLRRNPRMLTVFHHCGLPVTVTCDDVVHLVIDLVPETAGKAHS